MARSGPNSVVRELGKYMNEMGCFVPKAVEEAIRLRSAEVLPPADARF